MLTASNKGAGMNIGFPDVCLTPAGPAMVPVPYPNLAMNAQAAPFSTIVSLSMMAALNMGSKIAMTSGDEAGVAHPTIKGPGMFTMGNPKVFVEKLPAINLLCPSTGNSMNNGLGAQLVPSATNVFYTHSNMAASPGSVVRGLLFRELDGAAIEGLAAAMSEGISGSPTIEDGIGLVRIGAFTPTLPSELWSLLAGPAAAGMRGLVIDLSGCPGGDLMASLEAAGDFLPRGSLLATMVEIDGDETPFLSRARLPFSGPVAIVVDGLTASAAEIFAGCLSSHARAVLVGARTFGKGSGQKLVAAEDGAARAVSVAEIHLRDGRQIEGNGLAPDIEASSPEEARALARAAVLASWG